MNHFSGVLRHSCPRGPSESGCRDDPQRTRAKARTLQDTKLLADRYRLEEPLGSGGAGAVWRATDQVLDRLVAIKLLHGRVTADSDTRERFHREAVAAATLTHPNVVVTHDIGEDDGVVYLVMEHVDGPTLEDVLASNGALEPEAVVRIGREVAKALSAAHEADLVHRDIKPANVLLTSDGSAKVADFGIAKALGEAQTRLTEPGTVLGTIAYLAPEQLAGDDLDPRADIYSLGLVLNECLSGELPFQRSTPQAMAAARLAGEPDAPASRRDGVPAELSEVVARCTRQDPDARFADGDELVAALSSLTAAPEHVLAGLVRNTTRRRPRSGTVQLPDELAPTTALSTDGNGDAARTQAVRDQGTQASPPRGDVDRRPSDDEAADDARTKAVARPTGEDTRGDGSAAAGAATRAPGARQTRGNGEEDTDQTWQIIGLAALVLAVVLGSVLAFWLGSGGGSSGGGQQQEGQDSIAIANAQDYDPFGGGEEHREDVAKAHDGDPSTSWVTERYNSADLGGLKDGVGIWFQLDAAATPRAIELDLLEGGLDFSIYALDEQPSGDPADWGDPVATVEGADETTTIEIPGDVGGQYWVVWITSLGDGGGRAGVSEIRFSG